MGEPTLGRVGTPFCQPKNQVSTYLKGVLWTEVTEVRSNAVERAGVVSPSPKTAFSGKTHKRLLPFHPRGGQLAGSQRASNSGPSGQIACCRARPAISSSTRQRPEEEGLRVELLALDSLPISSKSLYAWSFSGGILRKADAGRELRHSVSPLLTSAHSKRARTQARTLSKRTASEYAISRSSSQCQDHLQPGSGQLGQPVGCGRQGLEVFVVFGHGLLRILQEFGRGRRVSDAVRKSNEKRHNIQ
jgi:hypothetical protein